MNELNLLTQIRTLLPKTNLVLLGYFDPYAPFFNQPNSPFYATAQASTRRSPPSTSTSRETPRHSRRVS